MEIILLQMKLIVSVTTTDLELEQSVGGRRLTRLQDAPDVLRLVERHLEQVALHHEVLELQPRVLRQLQHRRLHLARHERGLARPAR